MDFQIKKKKKKTIDSESGGTAASSNFQHKIVSKGTRKYLRQKIYRGT